MGRVKKKRIRWQPSSCAGMVKYRLYWAKDGEASYDSEYADLGGSTEVVLPDGIPSFPLTAGQFGLGITAVNEVGNESDLTMTTAHLNFVIPEPPRELLVEEAD